MAGQDQQGFRRHEDRHEEESEQEITGSPAPEAATGQAQSQEHTAGLDDLLDEIDGVLESNAEEFVRGFVQKGGQ